MATWTLRTEAGERGPLTIYQLQQLVSSGAVTRDAEVAADGTWRRIGDIPQLARLLPESVAAEARKPVGTVVVNGVTLERGPDGKPLPPTATQVAQMLAASGERTPIERVRSIRRILFGTASVLFGGTLLAALAYGDLLGAAVGFVGFAVAAAFLLRPSAR